MGGRIIPPALASRAQLQSLLDGVYATIADPNGWGVPRTMDPRQAQAAITPGANLGIFMRLLNPGGATISKVGIQVGTSNGNMSVAAYTNTGAGRSAVPGVRLATSGAVACPASGYAEVSLGASIQLAQGDWLCITTDSASATFFGDSTVVTVGALADGMGFVKTSSHPAPASNPASLLSRIGYLVCMIGVA